MEVIVKTQNFPARARRYWGLLAAASLLAVLLPLAGRPATGLAAAQQDLLFAALSTNGLTPNVIAPTRAGLPLTINVPQVFHSNGSQASLFPGGFKTVASPPVPVAGFTAVVVRLTAVQSAPAFAKVNLLVKNGTTGAVITSQNGVMIDDIPLDLGVSPNAPPNQHCQNLANTKGVVFQFTLAPPVNAVVVGANDDLQLVITPTSMTSPLDICVDDFTFYTGLGLIVEALPVPITLVPASDTKTVGSPETLTATVVDTNNSPKSGVTVAFTVLSGPDAGVTGTGVTDSSGHARFTYTNTTAAGTDVVKASFTDSAGIHNSNQSVITWTKQPTTLVYTGSTTSDFNDPTTLSVTVLAAGQSVPGVSVTFTIVGQSCSGTTDASGQASCAITPNQVAGSYTVMASFAGTPRFAPSSASTTFTVTREETTLAYTGDLNIANGGAAHPAAVLKEDGQTAIPGRTVSFTLGSGVSAQSCSGVTDATGTAGCTISPVKQPLGPGTVAASFAGDGFYRPASDRRGTLLFAFLGRGAFVIGNRNAVVGSRVEFWGAQWAKMNSLSGGAAPRAFKGFADTTSKPPRCGVGWSTDPGNSSAPPKSVPSFMGVIVSSSVTMSGSIISGNTPAIVIVKTDRGYAPNPGHAGKGTVVAVLCTI